MRIASGHFVFVIFVIHANFILAHPHGKDWLHQSQTEAKNLSISFKCLVCHWGANLLVGYAKHGEPIHRFLDVVSYLCHALDIEAKPICQGMVTSVGDQLFDIIQESNGAVRASDICGMIEEGECAKHSERMNNWKLDIPDLDRKSPVPVPKPPKKTGKAKLKILQISDPHVQWDYEVGSLADCTDPVCCSSVNGYPKDKTRAASIFGDYKCDLPPWMLDHTIREIRETHNDIDLVVLTGDFPAHDVWRQNRTLNLRSAEMIVDVMQKYFNDTPVFPAIGNHESYPVNMFPGPNEKISKYNPEWLYSNLAFLFKHWIPDEGQQETFSKGGYYSAVIQPGLRLISMNSNVCNNFNFFLLLNFNDPWHHLHWIYSMLHKAEVNKEKVIIIGHIPPGRNSCYNQWAHQYWRLVRRFNNTIVGQFFGHTHFDEFEIFFDEDAEAMGLAYLAPSLTPHDGINPAYRIYELDKDSNNMILDHSTYYFDIQESKRQNKLVHEKEYSAIDDLNLTSLSPDSWYEYVLSLAKNQTIFDQFLKFYYHFGPASSQKCNRKCKRKILCHLLTAESGNDYHCIRLLDQVQELRDDQKSWWNHIFG